MEPADFQKKLAEHFTALRDARASAQQTTPLFAIEHGLSVEEREEIAKFIRGHFTAARDRAYSLLWVVYATEIGYGFAGEEYWQTFQEQTPGWLFEHRPWLKVRFKDFQRTYGGFQPSGPWAEHFSTICWPIAHSLLPRDLQKHLARLLYEIRFDLTGRLLGDAKALGELIAANAWNASSRFRQLTEQPLLLGQIASALLRHGEATSAPTIYAPTLLRIKQDLERESIARSWMQSARAAVAKQTTSYGRPTGPHGSTASSGTSNNANTIGKRIAAARLEARYEAGQWHLFVHIPDLAPLAHQARTAAEVLARTRCIVNGRTRPLARGSVLTGLQIVRVEHPFEVGRPLLALETPNAEVDGHLRHSVSLTNRDVRLFALESTAAGFESQGAVLRPGSSYLVVSTRPLTSPVLAKCEIAIAGMQAWQLKVPDATTREFEQAALALGLRVGRTVEVWPAGYSAAYWDGQGQASWLSCDRIIIAVRTDFSIEGIALTLGGQTLNVVPKAVGEASFVDFGCLEPGHYEVELKPFGPGVALSLEQSLLSIEVRPPEVWRVEFPRFTRHRLSSL